MGLRIPAPDIKPVAADIKTWHDLNGAIYKLNMSTPERRSFYWLDVWVALKMLDNPNQNPERLIDTYLQGYYGPAAPHLRKFIDYASETIAKSEEKIARNELYSLRWRQCYDLPFLNLEYYTRLGEFLDAAEKACPGQDGYARAVRRERLMVDRAVLMHWDWLAAKNKDLPFNREKIVQRFSANGAEWFNWYWESGFVLGGGSMSFDWPRRNLIETEASAFSEYGRKRELPEAFGGIASGDMIDFAWPEFAFDRPADIQPDAAAFGGKAYHSKVNAYSARWGDQHQGLPSIRIGLNRHYSFPSLSSTWQEISIPRKDLPEDGKYHWYHVGAVPGYDHDTMLRIIGQVGKTAALPFSSLCRPGLENVPHKVYVSMRTENMNPDKAEKGKPELLAIDRVLFVKSAAAGKVDRGTAEGRLSETWDFETEDEALPEGWEVKKSGNPVIGITRQDPGRSNRSLKIEVVEQDKYAAVDSAPLEITAGRTYCLTAKYFAASYTFAPKVYIYFFDAEGKRLEPAASTANCSIKGNWTEIKLQGQAPQEAVAVKARFHSPAKNVGLVYFDEKGYRESSCPSIGRW